MAVFGNAHTEARGAHYFKSGLPTFPDIEQREMYFRGVKGVPTGVYLTPRPRLQGHA